MNIEEAIKYFEDKRKEYIVPPSVIHVPTVEVINILKQIKLDKPKPEIPQFVAEWIETVKSLGFDLYELLEGPADNSLEEWITNEDNQELIVKARLFGYTVEKEKLYKVRDKRLHPDRNYLNFDEDIECWFFSNGNTALSLKAEHTRKALEESGFNVFDDDNYEVIEVAE